jgi:uncharacterized protein (TIGR03435 family)
MKRCMATFVLIGLVSAQSRPTFEVASVKPADPTSPVQSWTGGSPGRFAARGTLQFFIQLAYDVESLQLTGGPKWLNSDIFEIDAKDERPFNTAERNLMLQTLLADRFKLVLHSETRELPVFALVVGKSGPKIQEVTDGIGTMTTGRGRLSCRLPIAAFARYLSPTLGRTVLDRTGLTGAFDIKLEWTPDGDDASGPSILTAVQEQLGLKLESARGPVEILVIEHAEKPAAD